MNAYLCTQALQPVEEQAGLSVSIIVRNMALYKQLAVALPAADWIVGIDPVGYVQNPDLSLLLEASQ